MQIGKNLDVFFKLCFFAKIEHENVKVRTEQN
jgi:hypothetical protein